MLTMGGDAENNSLVWNDDQSWAFPILHEDDNDGKMLIENGHILTGMAVPDQPAAAEKPNQEAPAPSRRGKKRKAAAPAVHGAGETQDEHELHIWTERQRRKKMRNMFASLQSLIPHLHPRADKSTTVDEAVAYIKKLQQVLYNLEREREIRRGGEVTQTQSREAFLADHGSTQASPNASFSGPESGAFFKTWTSPNVVINICENDAHINVVCSLTKPRILTGILLVMDKYNLELVSAHVSSDGATRMYMIHARVNVDQFNEVSRNVEETYMQAASELVIWINA